jgi:hypothetical protein
MAKTKNILTRWLIGIIGMFWCTLWAKVTFQPLYSDVRFQPTDKLHAGCTNSADILFSPQGQKITKIKMVIYYDPEHIEILRILPALNNGLASSQIEYNKIILEVQNPVFSSSTATVSFFQLYFKSNIVGQETLTLGTWSEAISANKTYPLVGSFGLDFAQVPECEPDIVPPSINLIYPKNTEEKIRLDQYFIFDIKDIGKGIDKSSVMLSFDGDKYFYESDNIKRNGNYLTFYPSKWIPINTGMDLKILIADKQSYWWANKSQSTYSFTTATGMIFNAQTNPMMFRKIVQEAGKISASVDECSLLADFYATSEVRYQRELSSIIQKVWCDLATIDTSLLESEEDIVPEMNTQQKQYRNISVFATLWWILFFISFTLKIHYILAYKKHKHLSEKASNRS